MIENEAQGVTTMRLENGMLGVQGKEKRGGMRNSEWREQELENAEYIWELQFKGILVGMSLI